MKDPEPYLRAQAIQARCPVQPRRSAVIDSSLRANVNYEIYYFSDREARTRFRKDPLRYCGLLTDPVNRVRFKPSGRSPHVQYHGRPYYFSADSTRVTFEASPDSFALRRGG